MSIAGGLHRAFDHISVVDGHALQVFVKNQRQWQGASLDDEQIALFKASRQVWGDGPVAAHASYLINLAALKQETEGKSVAALVDELQRCSKLGVLFLILHPGNHMGAGAPAGIDRVVKNIDRAFQQAKVEGTVQLLLETTSGQGTALGASFNELSAIIEKSRFNDHLGVCLDTCHIFAAGYDLRTRKAYEKTIGEFDRTIGLGRLKFIHLNDSKTALGSRKDRHAHIGQGEIGLAGFRFLLNDQRIAHCPMVLETPKGKDLQEDIENLVVLRGLIEK